MKKKTMMLVIAMALVVGVVAGATVAWITDKTNEVTNTFTTGDVKIYLDEVIVDATGKAAGTGRTQEGNKTQATGFNNDKAGYALIPGATYDKDPTVHVVKNSEDCYVRMFVTVNLPSAEAYTYFSNPNNVIKLVNCFTIGEGEDQTTLTNAALKNGYWVLGDGNVSATNFEKAVTLDETNHSVTVEFRHLDKVTKNTEKDTDLEALFTTFTVPEEWNKEELALVKGMTVDITAEAVQAANIGDDANAAWAVIDEQNAG